MPFRIVACEVWTNGMIDHGSTTKHNNEHAEESYTHTHKKTRKENKKIPERSDVEGAHVVWERESERDF